MKPLREPLRQAALAILHAAATCLGACVQTDEETNRIMGIVTRTVADARAQVAEATRERDCYRDQCLRLRTKLDALGVTE